MPIGRRGGRIEACMVVLALVALQTRGDGTAAADRTDYKSVLAGERINRNAGKVYPKNCQYGGCESEGG